MEKVRSFLDRSKDFEEAHCTCKELMADQINQIGEYTCKWLLIAISANFLFMILGFVYFHFEIIALRKKVDYRYFLMVETLEDIHYVKLENGKVIRNYSK